MGLYWGLLAVVGAGRLVELIHSRRNRRRMVVDHGATPGADPIFPLMVFLHVMPFWCIPLEITYFERHFIGWLGYPALVVFWFATLLRVWVFRSLAGYWNAQVMVPPDLEPVTSGPYQYIRHPNYLVVILELLALPLIFSAWWSALTLTLLNAFVLRFRIRDEEHQLFASERYEAAMGHRPRFIPRFWSR